MLINGRSRPCAPKLNSPEGNLPMKKRITSTKLETKQNIMNTNVPKIGPSIEKKRIGIRRVIVAERRT